MHEKQKEVQELKKLLTTTRLTKLDRQAIEARIEELAPMRRSTDGRPQPVSPYLLGIFDRPAPAPPGPPISDKTVAAPAKSEAPPNVPPQATGEEGKHSQELSLTPEETEARCKLLIDIAGRIVLLRSVWTTTLAFEVDREAEAWLARLQQIASTMPREAAEQALGSHCGYLDQAVHTVARPQIAEQLQARLLPPSAPSTDPANIASDLYWYLVSPPPPRKPERPVGYVPDGLQSWVS